MSDLPLILPVHETILPVFWTRVFFTSYFYQCIGPFCLNSEHVSDFLLIFTSALNHFVWIRNTWFASDFYQCIVPFCLNSEQNVRANSHFYQCIFWILNLCLTSSNFYQRCRPFCLNSEHVSDLLITFTNVMPDLLLIFTSAWDQFVWILNTCLLCF